jgi:hypothetical protein
MQLRTTKTLGTSVPVFLCPTLTPIYDDAVVEKYFGISFADPQWGGCNKEQQKP